MYKKYHSLKKEKSFIEHGGKRLKKLRKCQFSIITIAKNADKTIERTIKSVLNQKKIKFEYIIIDGNSKDKTLEIIKKYSSKLDYWVSMNDRGIYNAMNYGLKLANSKVICFVNSDDYFFNQYSLDKVNDYFEKNKKIDFLFGTVKRYYLGNNLIIKSGFDKKKFLYNFDAQTSHSTGFFIKSKLQKKIGLYDEKFKCSADYDLFFKIFSNPRIVGSNTKKNEIIGVVSSGGFSSKFGFWNHLIEETKIRIKNNQNYFLIVIIFINAVVKYYLKKLS
tara:strand:+ start:9792 stop:10622 length:831 start_codon:yes stop_codon:yes gene_type:complete